jgi:hypothetical protein
MKRTCGGEGKILQSLFGREARSPIEGFSFVIIQDVQTLLPRVSRLYLHAVTLPAQPPSARLRRCTSRNLAVDAFHVMFHNAIFIGLRRS